MIAEDLLGRGEENVRKLLAMNPVHRFLGSVKSHGCLNLAGAICLI